MDNLIIPKYSRVVRHPVLDVYQVHMDDVQHIDLDATKGKVNLGGFSFADHGFAPAEEGSDVARKMVQVARAWGESYEGERNFLLLEGEMLAEFEQLKASSCRSVVLVDCVVGHAFAIGHVSAAVK